eukprot:gb/GEZN01011079.1/.p1 GENE.gb/GEZN01011079.1/~~gb/GEZN01011079.1/.p1  ORF type:complete len:309 (+),score=70.57 gb/GEZN01011079.1/:3-929(+)
MLPLSHAVAVPREHSNPVVPLLLRLRPQDVGRADYRGHTPLAHAVLGENQRAVDQLLAASANPQNSDLTNINYQDLNGDSALLLALRRLYALLKREDTVKRRMLALERIVRSLLASPVLDHTLTNNNGKDPTYYGRRYFRHKCSRLVSRGEPLLFVEQFEWMLSPFPVLECLKCAALLKGLGRSEALGLAGSFTRLAQKLVVRASARYLPGNTQQQQETQQHNNNNNKTKPDPSTPPRAKPKSLTKRNSKSKKKKIKEKRKSVGLGLKFRKENNELKMELVKTRSEDYLTEGDSHLSCTRITQCRLLT